MIDRILNSEESGRMTSLCSIVCVHVQHLVWMYARFLSALRSATFLGDQKYNAKLINHFRPVGTSTPHIVKPSSKKDFSSEPLPKLPVIEETIVQAPESSSVSEKSTIIDHQRRPWAPVR